MQTNERNWQAFPSEGKPGLTKREYFAAQFMTALLANPGWNSSPDSDYEPHAIAKDAIAAADALIYELKEPSMAEISLINYELGEK